MWSAPLADKLKVCRLEQKNVLLDLHFVNNLSFRILALIRSKKLPLKNLKHFVLDECDKMLEQLGESFPGA